MQYYRLRAKYEKQILKPEHPLDIPEGTEVILLVVPPFRSFRGILGEVKEDAVTLQHRLQEMWSLDAN